MRNLKKLNRRDQLAPLLSGSFWDDDFFTDFFQSDLPAVNVKENKKEFKVEISIPGFEKNDINLNIDRNVLTISANREIKNEERDDEDKVLRQEFSSSSFYRSFVLPENIDTEKIDAKEKNGILKITLPKKEEYPEITKKKISIK